MQIYEEKAKQDRERYDKEKIEYIERKKYCSISFRSVMRNTD